MRPSKNRSDDHGLDRLALLLRGYNHAVKITYGRDEVLEIRGHGARHLMAL